MPHVLQAGVDRGWTYVCLNEPLASLSASSALANRCHTHRSLLLRDDGIYVGTAAASLAGKNLKQAIEADRSREPAEGTTLSSWH